MLKRLTIVFLKNVERLFKLMRVNIIWHYGVFCGLKCKTLWQKRVLNRGKATKPYTFMPGTLVLCYVFTHNTHILRLKPSMNLDRRYSYTS